MHLCLVKYEKSKNKHQPLVQNHLMDAFMLLLLHVTFLFLHITLQFDWLSIIKSQATFLETEHCPVSNRVARVIIKVALAV